MVSRTKIGAWFRIRHVMALGLVPVWSAMITTPGIEPVAVKRRVLPAHAYVPVICSDASNELRKNISSALDEAATAYGLEPSLLSAVIHRESRCEPKAKSHKGAKGLMQLGPATARELGVKNPYEIRSNILGGASYLSGLLKQFDGDMELALAAYNAGPAAVKKYGAIPPYRETKTYVKRVLSTYRELNRRKV